MIEINNLTNFKINKSSFSQVAKKVLKGENKETQTFSLAFVAKPEMHELNKKHRGKDEPTDVLSFSAQGGPASGWEGEKNFLGEIVVCPEVVREKKEDMMRVFIHGILHLLGYDHERSEKDAETMEQKENFYLNKA